MLEAPNLCLDRLADCLRLEYGLAPIAITFLPLGADVDTAVYRVETSDGNFHFLKLRRRFVPASVAVPALLAGQGVEAVLAPYPTHSGQFHASCAEFTLSLTPFVTGVSGWEQELTPPQWRELGRALGALHQATLPAAIANSLPVETYTSLARAEVGTLLEKAAPSPRTDAVTREFKRLLQQQRSAIECLLSGAHELGERLRLAPPPNVLCHGDIHAGNVLLFNGRLFIVDWDTLLLAPPERDLMFIGGGVGGCWNKPQEAEWFKTGYGPYPWNPTTLAYYRCERIVQDIAEFAHALLEVDHSEADRQLMLHQFASQFHPGNVVEVAFASCARL